MGSKTRLTRLSRSSIAALPVTQFCAASLFCLADSGWHAHIPPFPPADPPGGPLAGFLARSWSKGLHLPPSTPVPHPGNAFVAQAVPKIILIDVFAGGVFRPAASHQLGGGGQNHSALPLSRMDGPSERTHFWGINFMGPSGGREGGRVDACRLPGPYPPPLSKQRGCPSTAPHPSRGGGLSIFYRPCSQKQFFSCIFMRICLRFRYFNKPERFR